MDISTKYFIYVHIIMHETIKRKPSSRRFGRSHDSVATKMVPSGNRFSETSPNRLAATSLSPRAFRRVGAPTRAWRRRAPRKVFASRVSPCARSRTRAASTRRRHATARGVTIRARASSGGAVHLVRARALRRARANDGLRHAGDRRDAFRTRARANTRSHLAGGRRGALHRVR